MPTQWRRCWSWDWPPSWWGSPRLGTPCNPCPQIPPGNGLRDHSQKFFCFFPGSLALKLLGHSFQVWGVYSPPPKWAMPHLIYYPINEQKKISWWMIPLISSFEKTLHGYFPPIYHDRWIEVATRLGEVVRMFNGGTGEWCLASQEEMRIAEVVISKNDMPNFYWDWSHVICQLLDQLGFRQMWLWWLLRNGGVIITKRANQPLSISFDLFRHEASYQWWL